MKHRHPTPLFRAVVCGLGLCAFAIGASAADYPARKPGLWETSMQTTGKAGEKMAPVVSQQCLDAASDKALRDMGMGTSEGMCSQQALRTEGGKLVNDSVCKVGSSTVSSHTVISGDFSTAYRMDMSSKYSPPMGGLAATESVIQAKWLGPCKPGQRPGDMVMPGGLTMNFMDAMKGQGKPTQPARK